MENRRWIVSAGLALMIVACISAAWIIITVLPGHRSYASTVAAPAASRMTVQADDASIILMPGRGNQVRVEATGEYSAHRPVVTATTANSTTKIVARCAERQRNCNVTVQIFLPAGLDVTANSNNGDIQANRLTGALRLSTVNGDIDVTGSSGALSLQNQNGGIFVDRARSRRLTATNENGEVTAEFVAPPDFVNASSQNGTVDLTVPGHNSYAIAAHTINGHRDVSVPNSANSSHKLIATSGNADVVVQYGG